jgi:Rps23 Pro-64 3,4-dihydroxylase Tpa1-like proline 4-hydroxylase
MTTVEELVSRVSQLEETVNHLTTHHDEQFLMVHDDVTRDTCDRLFNVNLQQARRSTTRRRVRRPTKGKRIKRGTA